MITFDTNHRESLFHVCLRTSDGTAVLDRVGAAVLARSLGRLREQGGAAALAWSLTGEGINLLLGAGRAPLRPSLLAVRAALPDGDPLGPTGWRVHVREVTDEADARLVIAYVHLDPLRFGDIDLEAYPWSGHRELLGLDPPRLLDVARALGRFAAEPGAARRAYAELIRRDRLVRFGSWPERVRWHATVVRAGTAAARA